MLSYRHEFHAGNHADVLKHVVLTASLRYLAAKPKDLWYIDTHAGAGRYELGKNEVSGAEAAGGIGRLWGAPDLPGPVRDYVDVVARGNPDGELRHYPGSPAIAAALLRAGDRLWLSELHPADHAALVAATRGDRRIRVEHRDGLGALRALLPPAPRRALVMIDPSYERKSDYREVVDALADALRRFPTGVYATWYPLLASREAAAVPRALARVAGENWLNARLRVRGPGKAGLYGSGMFVVNPPYTLADSLATSLPALAGLLAAGPGAGHDLEHQVASAQPGAASV